MILAAATLPENSNDGYVAAAYIVFFVLLLVYVAVIAWRLARVERSVRTLKGTPHRGGQASEPRARERDQDDEQGLAPPDGPPHEGREEVSAGARARASEGEGQAV